MTDITAPITITQTVVSAPVGTGLAGPQGVKGDTGSTGEQGVKGDTGATGPQGDQHVFVQDSAPNFNGLSGLWVQTGLPDGGMTIWIEDGL